MKCPILDQECYPFCAFYDPEIGSCCQEPTEGDVAVVCLKWLEDFSAKLTDALTGLFEALKPTIERLLEIPEVAEYVAANQKERGDAA